LLAPIGGGSGLLERSRRSSIPLRELSRLRVVVSFSNVENNAATSTCSAAIAEFGVGSGEGCRFVERVDREPMLQTATAHMTSEQIEVISVISDNSTALSPVEVGPTMENV
jgi:hypothetical protein